MYGAIPARAAASRRDVGSAWGAIGLAPPRWMGRAISEIAISEPTPSSLRSRTGRWRGTDEWAGCRSGQPSRQCGGAVASGASAISSSLLTARSIASMSASGPDTEGGDGGEGLVGCGVVAEQRSGRRRTERPRDGRCGREEGCHRQLSASELRLASSGTPHQSAIHIWKASSQL